MNKDNELWFIGMPILICKSIYLKMISLTLMIFMRVKYKRKVKLDFKELIILCLIVIVNLIVNIDLSIVDFVYFLLFVVVLDVMKKDIKLDVYFNLYLMVISVYEVCIVWEKLL